MYLRHRLYDSHRLQQLTDDAAVRRGITGLRLPPSADPEPSQPPQWSPARVRPELVTRAATDRYAIVDVLDRLSVYRRQLATVPPLEQGSCSSGDRSSHLRRDDVAVQPDRRLRRGESLQLVLALVLGVHRQKPQNEQVHGGAEHGKADQNEDETEDEVLRPTLDVLVPLQRHVVAEADRRQRDDAVVDGVEIRPRLVAAEHPRTAGHHHA